MTKPALGIIIGVICSTLLVMIVMMTRPKTPTASSQLSQFSMTTVSTHNNQQDCWLVIDGGVYDVTGYVKNHPGGHEIVRGCGKDATQLFATRRDGNERIGTGTPHSSTAKLTLESLKIGTLTD